MKGVSVSEIKENKGITLSEYVENLQKDVEYVERDKINNDDHLDAEFNSEDVEIKSEPEFANMVDSIGDKELADLIVSGTDMLWYFGASFWAKHTDVSKIEMPEKARSRLCKDLARYLSINKIKTTPGMALFASAIMAYCPMTATLFITEKQAKKELENESEPNSNV